MPNAECRRPKASRLCRLPRCRHNCHELIGFIHERFHMPSPQYLVVNNQFHPEGRFIRFLNDRPKLRHKFRPGPRAARGPVIGANRRPTPNQLGCHSAPLDGVGKGIHQVQYAQGKRFRPVPQIATWLCIHHSALGLRHLRAGPPAPPPPSAPPSACRGLCGRFLRIRGPGPNRTRYPRRPGWTPSRG